MRGSMSSDSKFIEVNASTEGFDKQGDLIRGLKREIKTLKSKVISQDIRIFEMQTLLQSGKGLSNILNLPQLLDNFMAVVRERYDIVSSCVFLREDSEVGEKEFFQIKRYYGIDEHYIDALGRQEPILLFRIEKNQGLLWQLIQQGNVFSVRDLQKEPRFVTAWERLNLDVLRSDFWCPLIKSGEVIGVLALGEKRDGTQVSEGEFSFVQELASIATTIIDSTLKYEKNQRILNNIQVLYDVHQKLSGITDFKELCLETIKNAVQAVKAQKGNLMLLNRETGKLEMNVAWGHIHESILDDVNNGKVETKTFDVGEGIAGKAALTRKPLVVNNRDEIPQYGLYETYCICSMPVINNGRLEGVMNFTNKVHVNEEGEAILDSLGRFTKEDISLLQGIADQSAVSIHRTQLYSKSITDRLTGLYNARHFEDTYYEWVAKSVFEEKPLTLAVLDIDHFKLFNDEHGHKAGDFILRSVAEVMHESFKKLTNGLVYRYGGEEFCMVFQNTQAEDALLAIEEFRKKVEESVFEYEDKKLKVTVTIGVAQTGLHAKEGRKLFNVADEALYIGKRNGRNQVRIAPIPAEQPKEVG